MQWGQRENQELLVAWDLWVHRARLACLVREDASVQQGLWEGVVFQETWENQVHWARWESLEPQDFLVAQV